MVRLLVLALLALCIPTVAVQASGSPLRLTDSLLEQPVEDESLLISALQEIRRNRIDSALDTIEALVQRNPKFRLAQLVYADLLLAKAQPITDFGNYPHAPTDKIAALREEARARFRHYLSQPLGDTLPEHLLQLGSGAKKAVLVDVAQSRLYLFENRGGEPELAADYYVSTGRNGPRKLKEGDKRTPLGVYFITKSIPPSKLPDFYGAGAFPVNYPNEWDHRLGRTGYGIWIHGVPTATYSRPPRASDGCVALANEDFESIAHLLDPERTPVIIADGVNWIRRQQLAARREDFRAHFERWRSDWESLNPGRYARNYSTAFKNGHRGYASWLRRKRQVNAKKRYIKVGVSDVSFFVYPEEPELVVVTFEQDYRSDTYSKQTRKRQYWHRERDGVWRIVYEGRVRKTADPL